MAIFDFLKAPRCGARTRRGTPCQAPAMYHKKRCRLHGGKSTGPRTLAGKNRQRRAVTKHGLYAGLNHPDFGYAAGPLWRGHLRYRKQVRAARKALEE